MRRSDTYEIEPNPDAGQSGAKANLVYLEAKRLVRITCKQALQDFPFDAQDFTTELEMEGVDSSVCKFVPYVDTRYGGVLEAANATVARCRFQDMQLVKNKPLSWSFYESNRTKSRRKLSYSGLVLSLTFARESMYYVLNVAFVMFLICSFGFSAWAVDLEDVADRLSIDFTLLLTAVAFKLVLATLLPPVNYFTKIDIYLIACFCFLSLCTIAHCIIPTMTRHLERDENALSIDAIVHITLGAIWTAWNLVSMMTALALLARAKAAGEQRRKTLDKKLGPEKTFPQSRAQLRLQAAAAAAALVA